MKNYLFYALLFFNLSAFAQNSGIDLEELKKQDSLFWVAYNVCDVDKMITFFTQDMEFYHDNGGLTKGRDVFEEQMRKGMCKNPDKWSLRRVEIKESTQIYEINKYGALISGEHLFYINKEGSEEYLDGYGKYENIWKYEDGKWKMSRILSYDHKAPPEEYK